MNDMRATEHMMSPWWAIGDTSADAVTITSDPISRTTVTAQGGVVTTEHWDAGEDPWTAEVPKPTAIPTTASAFPANALRSHRQSVGFRLPDC
jgi:hypothetical protein